VAAKLQTYGYIDCNRFGSIADILAAGTAEGALESPAAMTFTAIAHHMWGRPVQYHSNCAVVYCNQSLHASLVLLLTTCGAGQPGVSTAAASRFMHPQHTMAV
jgi:hypothetical protein